MSCAGELLPYCPVCTGRRLRYAYSMGDRRAVRCADCQLLFQNPPPRLAPDRPLAKSPTTAAQAAQFLSDLARYRGTHEGRVLYAGRVDAPLFQAAVRSGLDVTLCDDVRALDGSDFDLCLLDHGLSHMPEPVIFLQRLHGALRSGGCLAMVTPALLPSEVFLRRGEVQRFDASTLQTALFFAGFEQVIVEEPAHSPAFAFCRTAPVRLQKLLSVVVPAFNEAATLADLMDALLAKRVPEMAIEIVLVESNSTDGTRAIAQRYGSHPRVKLILEERARGKGHAVRAGLAQATGDFVLIQDADLEYDLEDYDALLEPLAAGREAFVLGSRHSGSVWKMRQFTGQRGLSTALNFGHWIFTTLVNVLFRQRLKDPFTMYKVFRRDCLFGLTFSCNRFDFDYELLIKLIRKGYRPLELPVNYRSRSFKEGKKVSMVRDPLTWLRALVRLRFARIDPLAEAARATAPASAVPCAAGAVPAEVPCPAVP